MHTAATLSVTKPTVLFVSPFIWEGGAYKGKPTVYYIMQGFRRAGYEVHVVTATNKPGLRESEFEGLYIHYFHIPFNPVKFKYDAMESFLSLIRSEPNRLLRHLKFRMFWLQFVVFGFLCAREITQQLSPKLVYGINNPGIPISYLIARQFHLPAFSRIMGSPLGEWAQENVTFNMQPAGKLQINRLQLLKLWLARFDELLAFRLPCQAMIVTADGTISARVIIEWLGVPAERLMLWRNGIDKPVFQDNAGRATSRHTLGLAANHKIVLWVSQLVDWKHPERLIQAIPQIVMACPTAYFLFVGDGPSRATLETLVKELDISDKVQFAGFIKREKLPLYFHAANVFTAFYDYANISNTLLEAMLCGNAIVTLNNGHTGEVIRHLENGYMVEPDRLEDIPQALIHVLTDDALRQNLGRAAAAWADQNLLTWNERIDREIAAIELQIKI